MKPLFGSRIYLFLKTLQVKGDMQIIHLQDKPLRTSPETLRGLTGPGCASLTRRAEHIHPSRQKDVGLFFSGSSETLTLSIFYVRNLKQYLLF